ncbi:MAG: PIN domain-containing protein [Chloroflexi bacterium]|nr:PIN domain-containing protein [Chloroflexota bacterium]
MKILLDTNIVLDVLLKRSPWIINAQIIWQANDLNQLTGYLTATTITDIFYIARRGHGVEIADRAVDSCLKAFEICPVTRSALLLARTFPGQDFEDNLQMACAAIASLDGIVTRNPKDFSHSSILVLSPEQVVQKINNIS